MTTGAATKTEAITKETKFSRCKKAAIRTLSKIRSFYRRSVSECAGQMSSGLYGGEAGQPPHLHYSCNDDSILRSYSVSSKASSSYDDDYRHLLLLRAASANSITAKRFDQPELFRRQVAAGVGRSQSVGIPVIGRIDEEEPSEFEDDVNLKLEFQPKNRITGVTRRRALHRQII